MKVDVLADSKSPHPAFCGELGRVTIFLGANGSGKTKLLNALAKYISAEAEPENILRFNPSSGIGEISIAPPSPLKVALDNYDANRNRPNSQSKGIGLSNYIGAIQILTALDYNELNTFSSAAVDYIEKDGKIEKPKPPHKHLEELCALFTDIFGIESYIDKDSGSFSCKSRYNNQVYSSSSLSSGEKWALGVLPEFIALKDRDMYVIVDEPDTFLNEELAIKFWLKIEQERPKWKFLYATHSVNFASRIGIDKIYLLKSVSEAPREIEDLADIPSDDKRKLISVGPRLIHSIATLVVEGKKEEEKSSIDEAFYRAVLNDKDIHVVSIGNCHDVRRMVEKDEIWSKLDLSGIVVRGVIDRDYRSDEFLAKSLTPEIIALSLHDLEAYLCLPEFLEKASSAVEGHEKNRSFYEEKIIQHAIENRTKTIIAFLNNTFKVGGPISISHAHNKQWDTASIISAYCSAADSISNYIEKNVTETQVRISLNKIENSIEKAIKEKNIIDILRIYKGKQLFQELHSWASLEDEAHAIRLIAEKRLADDIEQFSILKANLQNLLTPEDHV